MQTPRATKAILLARVSDVRQDSEDAQLSNIRRYTAGFNFESVDIRKIKESSTKGDRRKFQEIIAEVKASKEPVALIVDTVDRLQRTFREYVLFDDLLKEGKVELYFQREGLILFKDCNSTDIMRWQMGIMFANSYIRQLGENVKRKFKQMREEGKFTSGLLQMGYLALYEDYGHGKRRRINLIPDPIRAPLIAEAYKLFSSGEYSLKTLTPLMRKKGLIGRRGKPITVSRMHYILTNPFYYGVMRSKYGDRGHMYEPLISEEVFMKVQKILKARRKNPTKALSNEFAFKGLILCKHCGCTYTPERKRGTLIYYSCTNAKHTCKREYIREEKLLEPVYKALSGLQLSKEKATELVEALKKNVESKSLYQKSERTRLKKIIDTEQVVIDGAAIKFARGEIEKDIYDRVIKGSREKQRNAEAELTQHGEMDENYFLNAERVIDVARRAKEIFENSEVGDKRRFLSLLLQNPTADGKNLVFTLKSPFQELASINHHPIQLASSDSELPPPSPTRLF